MSERDWAFYRQWFSCFVVGLSEPPGELIKPTKARLLKVEWGLGLDTHFILYHNLIPTEI